MSNRAYRLITADSVVPQPMSPVAAHFLRSLDRSQAVHSPYDYWLLDNMLPDAVVGALDALPFAPPDGAVFDGRRESNNSTRVYFNPEQQRAHPVIRDVVAGFQDPGLLEILAERTRSRLPEGHLRIEYCQDVDGFWLEPHVDISVKLFTMLIYLSDDPALRDAGTDVYDASPEHRLVACAPYERNKGMIFIPGDNTWHGFHRRPIRGLRKSLIVNYVAPSWRAREELA